MFDKYPKVRNTLKTLLNIFIGAAAYIAATILAKLLLDPVIVSFVEKGTIGYYALNGLASLVFIVFGYLAFVKFYEKRRAVELGFAGRNMVYGAIAGVVIISLTTFPLFAIGYYEVITQQGWGEMHLVFLALAAQAITGAILFQGVLFRVTEQQIGTVQALLLISVFFGFLNILVDGANLMVLVSTILISALWSSIYILSRNLWVVGISYGAWLFGVFVTGVLDEHWRSSAPVISDVHGPALLSGGAFGPEHSIITVALVSAFLSWILKTAKNKGLFIN